MFRALAKCSQLQEKVAFSPVVSRKVKVMRFDDEAYGMSSYLRNCWKDFDCFWYWKSVLKRMNLMFVRYKFWRRRI